MATDATAAELKALRERVATLEAERGRGIASDPHLEGLRQYSDAIEQRRLHSFEFWHSHPPRTTRNLIRLFIAIPVTLFIGVAITIGSDLANDPRQHREAIVMNETYDAVNAWIVSRPNLDQLSLDERERLWDTEVERRLAIQGIEWEPEDLGMHEPRVLDIEPPFEVETSLP